MTTPTLQQLNTAVDVLDWLFEQNQDANNRLVEKLTERGMFKNMVERQLVTAALQSRAGVINGVTSQLRQVQEALEEENKS